MSVKRFLWPDLTPCVCVRSAWPSLTLSVSRVCMSVKRSLWPDPTLCVSRVFLANSDA